MAEIGLHAWLRTYGRRIREGTVAKHSRRGRPYVDSGLEAAKGMLALIPGLSLWWVEAPLWLSLPLLGIGGAVALSWAGFVGWNWLRADVRYGDKVYHLVTKKMLSKDYRDG